MKIISVAYTPWHLLQISFQIHSLKDFDSELQLFILPHAGPEGNRYSITNDLINKLCGSKENLKVVFLNEYVEFLNYFKDSIKRERAYWIISRWFPSELLKHFILYYENILGVHIVEDGAANYLSARQHRANGEWANKIVYELRLSMMLNFLFGKFNYEPILYSRKKVDRLRKYLNEISRNEFINFQNIILAQPGINIEEHLFKLPNSVIKLHPAQIQTLPNSIRFDTPMEMVSMANIKSVMGWTSSSLFYLKAIYPNLEISTFLDKKHHVIQRMNRILYDNFTTVLDTNPNAVEKDKMIELSRDEIDINIKTNYFKKYRLSDNKIKVSIVVPIFNISRYLDECLSSLKKQRLEDIEIICINDGSTDDSLTIIEKYCNLDNRFKVINKQNTGYGHSVNLGIEVAQGEYLGIVESDDYVKEDMFLKLYEAAKKNDVDVAKGNFVLFWSSPKRTEISANMIKHEHVGRVIHPIKDRFVFDFRPTVWSAVYKKSFLSANGIKFLETPGASYQDLGFNFKIWATAEKAILLNDEFVFYRQDNEASSINNKSKVFCVSDEFHEIEDYLSKNPLLHKNLKKTASKLKFYSYLWNLNRLSDQYKWEFLKLMSKECRVIVTERSYDSNELTKGHMFKLYLISYTPRLFYFLKNVSQILRRFSYV